LPAEIGGEHLDLPDFIRQGKEGHHGFVKTASQELGLLPGEKIPKKHKKFRMMPFYPIEQNSGIMKNHVYTGKFIEGGNKRLNFPIIEGLKLIFPRTGRKVAGGPQDKANFMIHCCIYTCFILDYFLLHEKHNPRKS
jgi:hypothetical protein